MTQKFVNCTTRYLPFPISWTVSMFRCFMATSRRTTVPVMLWTFTISWPIFGATFSMVTFSVLATATVRIVIGFIARRTFTISAIYNPWIRFFAACRVIGCVPFLVLVLRWRRWRFWVVPGLLLIILGWCSRSMPGLLATRSIFIVRWLGSGSWSRMRSLVHGCWFPFWMQWYGNCTRNETSPSIVGTIVSIHRRDLWWCVLTSASFVSWLHVRFLQFFDSLLQLLNIRLQWREKLN